MSHSSPEERLALGYPVVLVRIISKIDTNVVTAQANIGAGGWSLFLTNKRNNHSITKIIITQLNMLIHYWNTLSNKRTREVCKE